MSLHQTLAVSLISLAAGLALADQGNTVSTALREGEVPHQALMTRVATRVSQEAAQRYPEATIEVQINPIDPRVRLPDCTLLNTQLQGERRYGRFSVAVSCRKPSVWKIFLTGDLHVALPVVVSRGAIGRSTEIQSSQVELEQRDISNLRNRYLTDLDAVIGWEARQDVPADHVFYAQQLKPARLVKKGDRVQITAEHAQISINATGVALSDGVRGQQIQIRNIHSGRIVHAWVRGPGRVSTRSGNTDRDKPQKLAFSQN